MLQSYKIDAELLYEDYRSEFFSDMTHIESKLGANSDTTLLDESLDNCGGKKPKEDHDLSIDPNSKVQQWRKTKDGWEREDPGPESPEQETEQITPKSNAPAWAKKLYKKIALASHPDRTIESDNRRRLNKVFAESASAMQEGDFNKLVGLALDLGIEFLDTDADHIPVLSQRIAEIKGELKTIEESVEWLWGESLGMIEMRKLIAHGYFRRKYNDLNIDTLADIIKEMEIDNEARRDT